MTATTPAQALLSALRRDGRGAVAIVLWPTVSDVDWLIAEIDSLLPGGIAVARVCTVEAALRRVDELVYLVPELRDGAEAEVVADLDSSRDLLLDRTQPLVLFLRRAGEGMNTLRSHPSLASWVSGSEVDPEAQAEIDVDAERRQFEDEVGEPPERWLERWNAGTQERNGVNYARAYWAAMLVPRVKDHSQSSDEPGDA